MKKLILTITLPLFLVACGEKPMTESEQAAMYNLTVQEFRVQKQAAARMNMSIEDHMKHAEHNM